jgi:hypothetical protein
MGFESTAIRAVEEMFQVENLDTLPKRALKVRFLLEGDVQKHVFYYKTWRENATPEVVAVFPLHHTRLTKTVNPGCFPARIDR